MDVFISYEHESKSIADNICSVLESRGIRCWYAPRDVYGDYATSIVEAIEKCKVFVLILNHNSSESPHVLNEVEMAYKRILNGEITIIPFKVDEGVLSKAMEYYVKRLHWIDAVSESLEMSINHLYDQLVPILGLENIAVREKHEKVEVERIVNQYYIPEDPIEFERIQNEEKLLYGYEKPYYDKLLFGKKDVAVLDFNVLCAKSTIRRFDRDEVSSAVFFSYDKQMVEEGNLLCKDNEKMRFYHMDLTKDNVDEVLPRVMKERGIDGFDFLNLTMTILDLESPFKVLKKIKRYLKPNAVAFVRDVDDTVVFAYPDENKYFAEFQSFYKFNKLGGFRKSGRQIYSFMKKLGAKEIRLERCGINTAGMDYDAKRLLFEAWFSFIPNDFNLMLKADPNDETAKEVLAWTDEYYDDLEEQFFSENFIFNAGYLMYTVSF